MSTDGFLLLAEDDLDVREALTEVLEDAGYRVVAVSNGLEAMAVMRDARPCLLLLDLTMPVMSGWRVFSEMRQSATLRSIPVCVVSAAYKQAPAGVEHVLAKPIDIARLLETIAAYC